MICRLCADDKSPDELIISLLDPTNILTFKEFVEYYCQISLDTCPSLPQRVCRHCKTAIDRFAAFNGKVEEAQNKLRNEPGKDSEKKIKVENEKLEHSDKPVDNKAKQKNADVSAADVAVTFSTPDDLEPDSKKSKLNESTEEDLLQEISFNESIGESSKSKSVRYLEQIDCIFDPVSPDYEKIQIPDEEVGKDGLVPRDWLKSYKDFTSWEDLNYSCKQHCNTKIGTLFAYTQHMATLPASERTLRCHICKTQSRGISFLGTYINHMSRKHFPYIKFCCIICSEVFSDMSHLSKHYQTKHFSENMSIYPCLECGFYSYCMAALRTHKKIHKQKVKRVKT